MQATTFIGIDMASQNAGTALCELEQVGGDDDQLRVVTVRLGCSNAVLAARAQGADWVGIDAPFGWPEPFVDAVAAWSSGGAWPGCGDELAEPWRREMTLRRTDVHVHERVGKVPLSVSSDRIAYVAMRTAHLLSVLGAVPVDSGARAVAGGPTCVEVYPAGTLAAIGADARGYKRADGRDVRLRLLDHVGSQWPQLQATEHVDELVASDHAFDALLSAITAWCAARGTTLLPEPHDEPQARVEGWIHLPSPVPDRQ